MTIKWTDKIKMQMREDFVNGVYNADGVIEWLSMDALIKKYRVARALAAGKEQGTDADKPSTRRRANKAAD